MGFVCNICDKTFSKKSNLTRHETAFHSNHERAYDCKQCKKSFTRRSDMFRHVRIIHQGKKKGSNCVAKHQENVPEILPGTSQHSPSLPHLNSSQDDDNQDKSEASASSALLSDDGNQPSKTTNPEIMCELCPPIKFQTEKERVEHHKRLHPHLQPYRCEQCDHRFSRTSNLKRHRLLLHGKGEQLSCHKCARSFRLRQQLLDHQLRKHAEGDGLDFTCASCDRKFRIRHDLVAHIRRVHRKKRHACRQCPMTFSREDDLEAHTKRHENKSYQRTYLCHQCGKRLKTRRSLICHQEMCKSIASKDTQSESEVLPTTNESGKPNSWESESALGEAAMKHVLPLNIHEEFDLLDSLQRAKVELESKIRAELLRTHGLKWTLVAHVDVRVNNGEGEVDTHTRYLRSSPIVTLQETEISDQVGCAIMKCLDSFDKCAEQGSTLLLDRVKALELEVASYMPLVGTSYLPLPNWLQHHKKGLLNIQNFNDEKCFAWSVIAGLRHIDQYVYNERVPRLHDPQRASCYHPFLHFLNMQNISYPVKINSLDKFEQQNPKISINVFGLLQNRHVVPQRITKVHRPYHINLLLIRNEDDNGSINSHYVLITNTSKLFKHIKRTRGTMYWCDYCLHSFTYKFQHDEHRKNCSVHGPQVVKLPKPSENIIKFTDFEKRLRHDYVIYADTEAILRPTEQTASQSGSSRKAEHIMCGYSYIIVDVHGKLWKDPVVYNGSENVARHFLLALEKEMNDIEEHRLKYPLAMTEETEKQFENATNCYLCGNLFNNSGDSQIKCRDHDHNIQFDNFRGAACKGCNLNLKQRDFIPVFLHNMSFYDAHHLIQELGNVADGDDKHLSVIPKTKERYISWTWKKLRFLDSLGFLPSSLDKLSKDLREEDMHILKERFPDSEQRALLTRKGVYPYEYFTDFDKFQETSLPPRETFFNSLTGEHISDEDWCHVKKVWNTFNMKTLKDLHNIYVLTDTLLLGDIFENFRKISMDGYGLDPAHYYTTPGFAWSAALLVSKVKLELLTDADMHLMVEKGIRGGVSSINKRLEAANNKYIPETFDPTKPFKFIVYLDCNGLYATAMSLSLPTGDHKWMNPEEIKSFAVKNISEMDKRGYLLEVDLHVPPHLHKQMDDYPLAPEHFIVGDHLLSPLQKRVKEELGLANENKVKKLIPNLFDKKKYVVLGTTLKLYEQLGIQIKHIWRGISFEQSPWLKSFIDFNTKKRQEAKTPFQKQFWKLVSNATYGKTIEGVRNRKNVSLFTHQKRRWFMRAVAEPTFKSFEIFDANLVAVESLKREVKLSKPIFVGQAVLDKSKEIMYNFHYNSMKPKYGNKIKVMGTDTDSFFYSVETEDFYADMLESIELFDTSDYPVNHSLYSNKNKKVLGKFKDEMNGGLIKKYVGLKAKLYAFEQVTGELKKVGKGIDKHAMKKQITLHNYEECVKCPATIKTVKCVRIGTDGKHHLFTINMKKRALSGYDDKRYICDDGINTFSHGNCSIYKHHNTESGEKEIDDEIAMEVDEDSCDEGSENLLALISCMDVE